MLQGHTHKHSEGEHITGEGELPGHHGAVSESELCEGGGAPCACDQLTKGRVLDCVAGGLRGLEDFRRRVWGGGFGRGGDLEDSRPSNCARDYFTTLHGLLMGLTAAACVSSGRYIVFWLVDQAITPSVVWPSAAHTSRQQSCGSSTGHAARAHT